VLDVPVVEAEAGLPDWGEFVDEFCDSCVGVFWHGVVFLCVFIIA